MNTMRAALIGLLTVLLAASASAQGLGPAPGGGASSFGGRAVAAGPRVGIQHPTPLAIVGGLAIGVWTRVPPPYDVTANRNGAENPLP